MSWNRTWKKGLIGVMTVSMLAACSSNDTSKESSIMNGNVINTFFQADDKLFMTEQLHHRAIVFEKGMEYQLFVEPEDVIPLL
jgi:major membrane immunogen (membrane-anchored lipoprotein)